MSWISDMFSSEEGKWETPPAPTFHRAPEYEEATGARGTWWDKLKEWGKQPGYGAISPDWADIWGTAAKRIKQYYWGGPGGQPGLAGKVRASAARRGVSESPALETELTGMGYEEAGKMGDLATTMGIKEAEFGETGRQNWLTSLMSLAGMKVPGTWSGGGSSQYIQGQPSGAAGGLGQLLGGLGGSMFGGGSDTDWLNQLLKGIKDLFGSGATGDVGGITGMGTDFTDWFGADALGQALP